LKNIDSKTLILLKGYRHFLTAQQYKTLRGQVLAGDAEGAMRGLRKLLAKTKESERNPAESRNNRCRPNNTQKTPISELGLYEDLSISKAARA
jgi:hypothetical protein